MTDPTLGRWQRIEALLQEALSLSPTARADFLDRSCAGDASLRDEVNSLLAAVNTGTLALDRPAALVPSAHTSLRDLPEGTVLGSYRLLSLIGRGGMGEVYVAERADGAFEQKVAIKLMRAEMGEHFARFQMERQILARLEHRGIARLLDGGRMADGRPYMVMEFVAGTTLPEYCNEHHLNLAQRLTLFRQVCDAVAFAHANLIVHRDLKGANILVTESGEVKLLDFGIAKLLDAGVATSPSTRSAPLTPEYAAPEQLSGAPITTATDVYALGVILHELLTGQRPWNFAGTPVIQALRIITREVPRPASEAARGSPHPPVSPNQLKGDLDAIVGKCLRKEPSERYASTAGLSGDVARYLRGDPVIAGPDSAWYRGRKFVRRNWAPVAIVSLMVLVLAGFSWRLARERDHALVAEQQARQVIRYVVSLFGAAAPHEAGDNRIDPRKLVDAGTAEIEQLKDQPAVKAAMLGVLGQIYQQLGYAPEAQAALEEAIRIQRTLPDADPLLTAEYLGALGEAYDRVGDFAAGERFHRQGLALLQEVAPHDQARIGGALASVGLELARQGKLEEGIAALEQARSLLESRFGSDSSEAGIVIENLAEAYQDSGDADKAREFAKRGVEIQRARLGIDSAAYTIALGFYGSVLYYQADYAEAGKVYGEALPKAKQIFGPDSEQTVTIQQSLSAVWLNLGRPHEAADLMREVVAVQRRAGIAGTPQFAISLHQLGADLMDWGDYDGALTVMREALQISEKQYGSSHLDTFRHRLNLSANLMQMGNAQEVLEILREEMPQALEGAAADLLRARRLRLLGDAHLQLGESGQAALEYDQAQALFGTAAPPNDPQLVSLARSRAKLLAIQGKHADAAEKLRDGLERIESVRGPNAPLTQILRLDLAEQLLAAGKTDEADALIAIATPIVDHELAPRHLARAQLAALRRARRG